MVRYLFYTIGDLTYQSPLVHGIYCDTVAMEQVLPLPNIIPPVQRIRSPTINSMLTSEMTTQLKYKILLSLTLSVTQKRINQTPVYTLTLWRRNFLLNF